MIGYGICGSGAPTCELGDRIKLISLYGLSDSNRSEIKGGRCGITFLSMLYSETSSDLSLGLEVNRIEIALWCD
jgi:hypothetical protein